MATEHLRNIIAQRIHQVKEHCTFKTDKDGNSHNTFLRWTQYCT